MFKLFCSHVNEAIVISHQHIFKEVSVNSVSYWKLATQEKQWKGWALTSLEEIE